MMMMMMMILGTGLRRKACIKFEVAGASNKTKGGTCPLPPRSQHLKFINAVQYKNFDTCTEC